jgi:mono/diheme cytochrome c family protein
MMRAEIRNRVCQAAALALAAGTIGCTAPAPQVEVGRAAFQDNCASCHGTRAMGDGPMAVFVRTGVPNLRELSLRNGGAFPEGRVVRVITRISDLHADIVAMPDFGALLTASPTTYSAPDGETIPTDAKVIAIMRYLESIQSNG